MNDDLKSDLLCVESMLSLIQHRVRTKWCQRAEAMDVHGDTCTYKSPHAKKWSVVGAAKFATWSVYKDAWDHTYVHADVVRLIARAAAGEDVLDPERWLRDANDAPGATADSCARWVYDAHKEIERRIKESGVIVWAYTDDMVYFMGDVKHACERGSTGFQYAEYSAFSPEPRTHEWRVSGRMTGETWTAVARVSARYGRDGLWTLGIGPWVGQRMPVATVGQRFGRARYSPTLTLALRDVEIERL